MGRYAMRTSTLNNNDTGDLNEAFFMKRVRVCNELFGDANFHADRLARLHLY